MARNRPQAGLEAAKSTPGRPPHVQAWRDLGWSGLITVALTALLAASVILWGGSWTPKLGLDLEGGTQMVLQPQVVQGQTVSAEQLNQAVDIMRARVDGQGVAEAEVSTLGDNVVVSVPGRMTKEQEDALRASSQMAFRPVLSVLPRQVQQQPSATASPTAAPTGSATASATPSATRTATPSATASATPSATRTATPSATASAAPSATATASASPAASGRPPAAAPMAPPAPSPTASSPAEATPSASGTTPAASGTATAGAGLPTGAGDTSARVTDEIAADPAKLIENATSETWLTDAIMKQALATKCTAEGAPASPDPRRATVACSLTGDVYILGPTVMDGTNIADASSAAAANPQTGQLTGGYEVRLQTKDDYAQAYATISGYMVGLQQPRNQLAAVLDNRVISAPYFSSAITGGRASITGDFSAEQAQLLANQLKFGALPISFTVQSTENVSPVVGGDQLRNGIIAGLIGLVLVFAYFLWQYRALGLVTVASVVLVGVLTYLSLALLGWGYNLRLTLAGVTGAIVAIGTTADSFIVYFERVRDEVRDGKRLEAAVQAGWARARRTIVISDLVNLLAAVVLYLLAAANVRGFAFMLILTTILDLIVTFLFTHPLLTLLSRTRFFGGGHRWSGFDRDTLGGGLRYAGAGRFTTTPGGGNTEGSPA